MLARTAAWLWGLVGGVEGPDAPLMRVSGATRGFRQPSPYVAIDVGGTLTKAAVLFPPGCAAALPPDFRGAQRRSLALGVDGGGRIVFLSFRTDDALALRFLEQLRDANAPSRKLRLTGGGADRTGALVEARTPLVPRKVDELVALVTGLNYIRGRSAREAGLAFHMRTATGERVPVPAGSRCFDTFPYLLVNIGTGTSFVLVESPVAFRRVGGTGVGGGTFLGLGRALAQLGGEGEGGGGEDSGSGSTSSGDNDDGERGAAATPDFDALLRLAVAGQADGVDMLVGEIYGRDYTAVGLTATTLASCFGKGRAGAAPRDLVAALLRMVCLTLAQLANLYCRLYRCRQAVFSGNFLRDQAVSMSIISDAMDYWSGGRFPATFLRHEGFLGALGALVGSSDDVEGSHPRAQAAPSRQPSVVPVPDTLDRFGEYARHYPAELLSAETSETSAHDALPTPRHRPRPLRALAAWTRRLARRLRPRSQRRPRW